MDRCLENNIEYVETNSTHETDVPNESISKDTTKQRRCIFSDTKEASLEKNCSRGGAAF